MASACSSSSVWSSSSLGCSRWISESSATPSNRVFDGPARVRCTGASQCPSLSPSFLSSERGTDSPTLSASFPSPNAEEWWRKAPQSHCSRSSSETGVFGATVEREKSISDPSMADWRLDEPTWVEHHLEDSPSSRGTSGGVPVFVMLPLDTVNISGNSVNRRRAMNASLLALKSAGVEGIMLDVWWGIVEKDSPQNYNWSAYRDLIEMARKHGLKVQAVMSFHQCGGNVGDHCNIPLPHWVIDEVRKNNDMVYTDKYGNRNDEYLSLGVDELPVLKGRSPVQVYSDFMRSFREHFRDLLGETIIEIQVGMGPAGELRYPGYPEQNGRWRFPGIGEFQCYDKYMLASLKTRADAEGYPGWGNGGPSDAGNYNQFPDDTSFFKKDGGWKSAYGKFFLEWYSEMLIAHGERILSAAEGVFRGTGVGLSGKVAGVHWHYGTRSHAAELTAGYFNTRGRDGYLPIARMFGRHGVTLNFTCIEMKDEEQPPHAQCSPESLLRQVASASRSAGVHVAGENALPRFDQAAHDQVVKKSRLQLEACGDSKAQCEPMRAFTFLRMSESLFYPDNWRQFVPFVRHMKEGRTFQPWEQEHRESESRVHATGALVHEAKSLMYH